MGCRHTGGSAGLGRLPRDDLPGLERELVDDTRPGQRRFEPAEGTAIGSDLADWLGVLRDECGGQSPGGERLFSVDVNETPYQAWAVRGTRSRIALRLTADARRYFLLWPRGGGKWVLHVDTLGDRSTPRHARWVEADATELPAPPKGTTLAADCWRSDSLPTGSIVAIARATDTQFRTDVLQAWALDRSALRMRPVPADGVECLNPYWNSLVPDAPRALRAAALTFRPSAGMARIYAYLSWPDFPVEYAIANVAVDSQLVGRLGGGSFLMVEVEPGRHRVSSPAGTHENVLWLDAAPDSSCVVELRTDKWARSFRWRAKVRPMDAARARGVIPRAHMTPSSWPGTPLGSRE